jgi:hypothetical protein
VSRMPTRTRLPDGAPTNARADASCEKLSPRCQANSSRDGQSELGAPGSQTLPPNRNISRDSGGVSYTKP